MFIMNKKRTCIIKPTSIYLRDSKTERDKVDICAVEFGNDVYLLGTYDSEYAIKELEDIYTSLSDSKETYKMSSDKDVEEYYIRQKELEEFKKESEGILF